jgi:RNA polymerase sigma factor (TIGR02999 family)
MREILVDHARRRAAARRSGQWERVPLDLVVDYFEAQDLDVSEVHEAVVRLTALNERQGHAITLRYFGGMTVAEVAGALGVAVVTVERDCRIARAWLHGQLRDRRFE